MSEIIKENIKILPMKIEHLQQVFEIEQDSFSVPWTMDALEKEIADNELAYYFIAQQGREIVGYIGMWHVVNEGHITNVAVKSEKRGLGIGSLLIEAVLELAYSLEMIGITLEVRVGNRVAMNLYSKYGFKMEGIRKNYYSDTKEDAVIMWKYL